MTGVGLKTVFILVETSRDDWPERLIDVFEHKEDADLTKSAREPYLEENHQLGVWEWEVK